MAKASVLMIRIPADLKRRIALIAEQQGVSISQYMFAKEVGNLEASQKNSKYWKDHSKEKIIADFDEVMAKVKDMPAPDWDKIEPSLLRKTDDRQTKKTVLRHDTDYSGHAHRSIFK